MLNPPRPWAAAVLAAVVSAPLAAQDARSSLPPDRIDGAAAITEADLRAWLGTLASPEFGGRGTGQEGFAKAAEYVRAHFEALGLEPGAPDGSYLQVVPWTRTSVVAERSGLSVTRDGEELWRAAPGVLRGSASQDENVAGPLVLVSTGARDGADLKGLALSGAAVIVVPATGVFQVPEARDWRARRQLSSDVQAIRNQVAGAGGTVVAVAEDVLADIAGDFGPTDGPTREGGGAAAAARNRRPTVSAIDRATLGAMLAAVGVDADDLARAAPARIEVPGVDAALRIELVTEPAPACNVLAILRGSDPDLRDEFVGIGAHLDHLGTNAAGVVHPGADDDGSGSAGLMAIAAAFANNPVAPRRSVLFMAFCGEERGLLGSAYFAAHPTVPLEKLVAELQVDMIGRNEEKRGETAADNLDTLHLVGSQKLSTDLHEVCIRLNAERAGFTLEWDEEGVFYRSDHWNFAREGVPIAFFFTGFHPDYHQPSDTPDKIDYGKLRRIATYVYDIAYELADAAERPRVDAERWDALQRKGRAEPAAPVRR